jgi:hypothetical protein
MIQTGRNSERATVCRLLTNALALVEEEKHPDLTAALHYLFTFTGTAPEGVRSSSTASVDRDKPQPPTRGGGGSSSAASSPMAASPRPESPQQAAAAIGIRL